MSRDLTNALRDMMAQPEANVVPALKPRGAGASVKSSAPLPGASGESGGIASPLTETNYALREYHATGWKSSDGLFTFPAIKKVVMTDAATNVVVFNFASPK